MSIIVDKKDEAIYMGSYEVKISFAELKVLNNLGLHYDFEEIEMKELCCRIIECLKLYVALYVYKTELLSLEQLCVDKIEGPLLFKPKVSRSHLDLPELWYQKILYRLLLCGLNKVKTILYRNPMIPPKEAYFVPVHRVSTDIYDREGYIDYYLEYYALSNVHKCGYKITRSEMKRRHYPDISEEIYWQDYWQDYSDTNENNYFFSDAC